MEFLLNINNVQRKFDCVDELLESKLIQCVSLVGEKIRLKTTSISERYFIFEIDGMFVISDNLKFISSQFKLAVKKSSIDFYYKYGFILPPFTHYDNVFITVPGYIYYFEQGIVFEREKYDINISQSDSYKALQISLEHFFKKNSSDDLTVLVSGGIDSSALLGFLHKSNRVKSTIMCKMSSLPSEGRLAANLSSSIGIPFNLIDLDIDLSERASEFCYETGELISDPISIVFPELFERVCSKNDKVLLVDGQGADSLLNGLPLNKLFDLWYKARWLRVLMLPLSFLPVYKDKSTRFKRKIYRVSKAIKSISQRDFAKSILTVITESEGNGGPLEEYFLNELNELKSYFCDWHFVIKYIYMFRVLPAREMQKYLLSNKYNIAMVKPFLDEMVIKEMFPLSNDETIKNGLYKYPITKMAQSYWPGVFNDSKTSPFQVEYKIGSKDLKELSIGYLRVSE